MPADDSLFEKALARQLRNRGADNAARTNGESASDGPLAGQRELCPEVELLAAYHERSLANDEMSLWKEHIFSCARCQEILSQLEGTENILVSSEQDEVLSVAEGSDGQHLILFAAHQNILGAFKLRQYFLTTRAGENVLLPQTHFIVGQRTFVVGGEKFHLRAEFALSGQRAVRRRFPICSRSVVRAAIAQLPRQGFFKERVVSRHGGHLL